MRQHRNRRPRKPVAPPVTLAQRLVAAGGQRLRQGESASWATFLVAFRAQRQAGLAGGAR